MKKGSHNSNSRGRRSGGTRRSASKRRSPTKVNPEWLKSFFSEMLAVERGGTQLYEKAVQELAHDNLRSRLEQFREQTERHVELCQEMLAAAGGEDDDLSPGAEAAEHKAHGLLTAEVPQEMADLNNIENLVLAETKDHWNWETLSSLITRIEDSEVKKLASRAVREVRKQENDHLSWNQKTLTQLAMEAAYQAPAMEEMGGEAEDEETEELEG